MAHKRKDTFAAATEVGKHLRPADKRLTARAERRAAEAIIREEVEETTANGSSIVSEKPISRKRPQKPWKVEGEGQYGLTKSGWIRAGSYSTEARARNAIEALRRHYRKLRLIMPDRKVIEV